MVGFYKHDIPAWMDGTEALSDAAYRAYHVVVQLIMLNEGPITRNDRGIAGRCNQTLRTFQRALDELLVAGKLTVVGNQITNARAGRELAFVMKNRENAGKGGKTRADREKARENNENSPANPLINNEAPQAALESLSSLKEKRREDNTPLPPKGAKDAKPDGFDQFWAEYPKRDGANPEQPAAQRYASALKAGATPETLLRAVRAYAAEMKRKGNIGTGYVKQAQFWLSPRDRLWEHYARQAEPQRPRERGDASYLATLSDERWREEVKLWKGRGGYWPLAQLTPQPDDPRTAVPRHILAEMNIHPARARAA